MKPTGGKQPRRKIAELGAALRPNLRGKVWVEIGKSAALTEAGADLLEQIAACGSLSEAARRLHYSYRRAWLLIDAMNRHWPKPLVTTAVGGERGGGTRITELGSVALRSYRDLQLQLEHLLDAASEPFAKSVRSRV
ncbi:MAG: ModE family transcriptional regulator [Tepidisphaeraceae bacterium]|jgi:molybdate transport system regulatory protein